MDEHILTSNDNGILRIILNHPEKVNAIGIDMLYKLSDIFSRVDQDESVRSVLVTGAGEKSFSAGGNLNEFRKLDKQGIIEWIRAGHKAFYLLENLNKPTIAAISGYCLGGGLELTLACDFRIAAENAVFGSPELKHGWIPGWGGLARLKRLIGESRAKEIIMLSENFDAKKAYDMGMVQKITSRKDLLTEAIKLSQHLGSIEPFLFNIAKRGIMDSGKAPEEGSQLFDILGTLYSKGSS